MFLPPHPAGGECVEETGLKTLFSAAGVRRSGPGKLFRRIEHENTGRERTRVRIFLLAGVASVVYEALS